MSFDARVVGVIKCERPSSYNAQEMSIILFCNSLVLQIVSILKWLDGISCSLFVNIYHLSGFFDIADIK